MLYLGRMWKALGHWTRKVLECCNNQNFMGHLSRSSEDNGAGSSMDYGGPAQKSAEENTGNWARDHSWDVVPENLPEAKLKSKGLSP